MTALDRPADDDELALGIAAITERVFDGKLNERQAYREITKNGSEYGAFKRLNKHAVYIGRARKALHRRGQPTPEEAG